MPASWNPLDPQFKVDPYPSYRSLLEEDPFHRSPFGPLVLSRYDDCLTMLRHPAASSDQRKVPGWQPPPGIDAAEITPSFLSLDPPDHTRLRALVAKAFTPRRAEALRPRMQEIVEGVVDHAAGCGSMEVVGDLAFPLPVLVICELLGVPPEDVDEFKEWSAAVARTLDPAAGSVRRRRLASGGTFLKWCKVTHAAGTRAEEPAIADRTRPGCIHSSP